jgi:hypothetical protein
VENGDATYYLRSSVLGGQVICEIKNWGYEWGWWWRGYVYLGGQLLAIQAAGVTWVHQDPMSKGQRFTDTAGNYLGGHGGRSRSLG